MSSLIEKMLKTGSTSHSSILSKSKFFDSDETITTDLPILNIAFSGSLAGGLLPGLTVVAGASKSFKCCAADTKIIVYKKVKENNNIQ